MSAPVHTEELVIVMTAPVDRSGLELLTYEESLRRLRNSRLGRVAFVCDGLPLVLPVNHILFGDAVVFRTGGGSKLAAAQDQLPVAFEIDGFDSDRRSGWSVLVRGELQEIRDQAEITHIRLQGLWPWADGVPREHFVRIANGEVTGRQTVDASKH